MSIENPKIVSSHPLVWAPFPGLSYLCDNPGRATAEEAGLCHIRCDLSDPRLRLYAALAEWTSRDNCRRSGMGLCAVAPETYHVTVWDGLHQANLDHLTQPARAEAAAFLHSLPPSAISPLPGLLPPPRMRMAGPWSLGLRFKRLRIGIRAPALIALLEPVDAESRRAIGLIDRQRRALDQWFARLGKPANPAWAPHVTLGYFTSGSMARAATHQVGRWTRELKAQAAGQEVVRFSSISLYAFLDMARFWLLPSPAGG